MKLALITVAAGRHDHLRLQLDGVAASDRRPDLHVVVAMGDPEIAEVCGTRADVVDIARREGRLPLAAARNAGAAAALAAGAQLLVFLDVDCVPDPRLFGRYVQAADAEPDSLLSGPVAYLPEPPPGGYRLAALPGLAPDGHPGRPVPADDAVEPVEHTLFWSLSFAVGAATWQRIGGFHEAYIGYGAEDTDFGRLAQDARVTHVAVGGAWAYHQWHPAPNPPLQHLEDIVRNGRIFFDRWAWWPMESWMSGFERFGLVQRELGNGSWTLTADGARRISSDRREAPAG